ncbi:MAG: glycosyltransferase family 4 protein [Clostridia bacterium]|nr:glycosyltransferase family 4 protein [Clostridia bacterium]
MKTPKVFMVGPSFKTQGGISSVLKIYHDNYKSSLKLNFIPSYLGKNRAADFIYFAQAAVRVFINCILHKNAVFHIHSSIKGSYLRKSILANICMAFKRKVVFHIHSGNFDRFVEGAKPGKREKIIGLLNKVDRVVALSNGWYNYFSTIVPANRLLTIYNPCFTVDKEYKRRTNSKVNILFIGRLGERKGIYDLMEAVKKIRDRNFELRLYGDGDNEAIKDIVNKNNLNNRVVVNDWVPHTKIGQIYETADILVLPSYAEGLPMSVLEAIGKGLPVVSTDVGGIPEAVFNGRNGFIIKPGDIDALAEKMRILIDNPALREEMGRNSLAIASERFSVEKIGQQLEELYRTVNYKIVKQSEAQLNA